MSGAIGATGSTPAAGQTQAGTGTSKAQLEAQVDTYKKQLSDCVSCPATSNSRAGKEQIQTLTNKISSAEARIETLTLNESTRTSSTQSTTDASVSAQAASDASAQNSSQTQSSSNSRIDTFA